MARQKVKKLLRRGKDAWEDKELWRSILEDAYELASPMRNVYDRPSPGQRKMDRVFDSTLPQALFRFSSRLQSELTPPLQKWGNLVPGPLVPEELKEELTGKLQVLRDIFFATLATSNWDTAVHEYWLELGIGTAAMLVLEGDDETPIHFVVVPQPFFALEEGPYGGISAVFRKYKMSVRNIEPTWSDIFEGEADGQPDGWALWLEDQADSKVEIQEITYQDHKTKKWYYDVIICAKVGNSGEEELRAVARTYNENPWVVSRWSRNAFEVQGRGPVLLALPDAKVLNKTKELILQNASLAVVGVWTGVDDGVLNPRTVAFKPGAVIPVASNGGGRGPSLQSITPGGEFDVAQLIIEDHQLAVKRALFDDQLPSETGAVRSATEIIQRSQEIQSMIESPFARLHQEFIRPLFQRVLSILAVKGLLGDLSAVKVDGAVIDIQMTSQLAQAENLKALNNYVQMLELSQTLLGPEVTNLGVKTEQGPAFIGRHLGVDSNQLRSQAERDGLAQQQQQQQALASQREAELAAPPQPEPMAAAA